MLDWKKPLFFKVMKILIVDDNFKMREMTRSYLEDLTEEFRECEDGSQALSSYSEFYPDFVLMDWEMKEMDGITATGQIIERFPEARILLVTQYDDPELREAATDAGAIGFVLKDDLERLRSILSRNLRAVMKLNN